MTLPADVDVCAIQPPGRGFRFRETPYVDIRELAKATADGLEQHLVRPYALFGHSLGALTAFELAREFRRRKWPGPVLFATAAHAAPHLRHLPNYNPPLSARGDTEFIAELRDRFNGIPATVVNRPELIRALLPILRADVRALEGYRCGDEPPLDCPIVSFGGSDDKIALDDLDAWRHHTSRTFTLRMFEGGHFFVDTARALVLQALREELFGVAATE